MPFIRAQRNHSGKLSIKLEFFAYKLECRSVNTLNNAADVKKYSKHKSDVDLAEIMVFNYRTNTKRKT